MKQSVQCPKISSIILGLSARLDRKPAPFAYDLRPRRPADPAALVAATGRPELTQSLGIKMVYLSFINGRNEEERLFISYDEPLTWAYLLWAFHDHVSLGRLANTRGRHTHVTCIRRFPDLCGEAHYFVSLGSR